MKGNNATAIEKNTGLKVWEIDVSDLGACKPFLGYSLTDQYILVGITDPNHQNEVSITSIPESNPKTVHIPLVLSGFESSEIYNVRFTGLDKISGTWNVRLFDRHVQKGYRLREGEVLKIEEKGLAIGSASIYRMQTPKKMRGVPRFELVLTEKFLV